MKVLYITPYTPDPVRVRPYNLVRYMARRGHQVTLATLWSSAADRCQLAELEAAGIHVIGAPLARWRSLWNCARTLPRPTPLQSVFCWEPALFQMARAEIQKSQFDIVHVEHLRGARYGTHLRREFATEGAPAGQMRIVWDSVDCISYLFEQAIRESKSLFGRFVTQVELPRTRWYEAWLVSQFNRVLMTSDLDKRAFDDLLQEFAPHSDGHLNGAEKLSVLRNGVDLQYFAPVAIRRAPQTLVFSGKMSYHANVTAALYLIDEVMPLVWAKFPNAVVEIVGKDPPQQIRHLAVRNPSRVVVSGTVQDMRPHLAQAALSVAPITYGAGIQNKVLEAMAMGTPVVATSKAVAALSVENEEHLLVGNDPESLSQQIVRLLRNPALGERLGANGRRYVELNHDWNLIVDQLLSMYQEVVTSARMV
ncbi:MAG: glycosyltransferase [Anaerolineae bacterium]